MKTILRSFILLVSLVLSFQITTSATTQGGKLVTVGIHSPGLENNVFKDAATRNVTVYLPACYEADQEKSYPVLYLLPWENSTHKGWFSICNDKYLQEILDNCILAGKIKPMIVVVPDGSNKMKGSWYSNSLVTGKWEDYIVKDVVEYIDFHFRTIPFAESRGIAGHSMGGYGALKLATKHPDVFSAVYSLNAFVDFETFMSDTVIWKKSITTAQSSQTFPTGDPLSDKLIAMAAAFAPDKNNEPFYGSLFRSGDGSFNAEAAEKWLDHDPYRMINTYEEHLKKLKGIIIDCSNSDATIFLNSRYHQALKNKNIPADFRYYSGSDEKLLLERARQFMLPMFSEKLMHSLFQIENYSHCYLNSDNLKAKILKDATIYIVPLSTEGNVASIASEKVFSTQANQGTLLEIPLQGFKNGIYRLYGISSNGFIDKPVIFGINDGVPTVQICAVDSYTGEKICCCLNTGSGSCSKITEDGYFLKAMGNLNLCLKNEGYCTVNKSVTVYSDTAFLVHLIKDSYVKVIDKTSKEPVYEAVVSHEMQANLTNNEGIAKIQNLQNGNLNCRIFRSGYFTEVVSVPLIPGETAVLKMTRKKAQVSFELLNDYNPVPGINVLLNEKEISTDQDGKVAFDETDARKEYSFTIKSSCYETVSGSFFLETDTIIKVNLQPDISHLGFKVPAIVNSLLLKPSVDGIFYLVHEDTESNLATISTNYVWKSQILAGSEVTLYMTYFPGNREYILYFIPTQICNYQKSAQLYTSLSDENRGKVMIYPNPVKEELTIQFNRRQHFRVEIINLHGKILYQSENTGISHKVNLSSFSSGVYFVHIKSADFTVTQKVMKQ
jgi:S-formylglutathione hydrolase